MGTPVTLKGTVKLSFVKGATNEASYTSGIANVVTIIGNSLTIAPSAEAKSFFAPTAAGSLELDDEFDTKHVIDYTIKTNKLTKSELQHFLFGDTLPDVDDYNEFEPMQPEGKDVRGIAIVEVFSPSTGSTNPAYRHQYFGFKLMPEGTAEIGAEAEGTVGFKLKLLAPYGKVKRLNLGVQGS